MTSSSSGPAVRFGSNSDTKRNSRVCNHSETCDPESLQLDCALESSVHVRRPTWSKIFSSTNATTSAAFMHGSVQLHAPISQWSNLTTAQKAFLLDSAAVLVTHTENQGFKFSLDQVFRKLRLFGTDERQDARTLLLQRTAQLAREHKELEEWNTQILSQMLSTDVTVKRIGFTEHDALWRRFVEDKRLLQESYPVILSKQDRELAQSYWIYHCELEAVWVRDSD